MKYIKFCLILFFIAIVTLPVKARNVWNVYAGGSLSHICETPLIGSDRSYGWGGGAFIGCGYELNFNSHWSITPQVELSYADNGASLSSPEMDFFTNHNQWMRSLSVNVPIMVSYRLKFTDTVGMRFAVGPYLQEALVGEKYINDT